MNYQDAVADYEQGAKYPEIRSEEENRSPYERLAQLYMRLGRFSEAAEVMTRAIMQEVILPVILFSGVNAFRELYPEYDALPDEILAEAVRRRYLPQISEVWDAEFGSNESQASSVILPVLYVIRGDAYMKEGRRADALSDYRRVLNNALGEKGSSQSIYFDEHGIRNYNEPEPWPPPPAQ